MPLFPAIVAADQAAVQARRTTTFALSGSFANITLDTTDLQNDVNTVEHDSGNMDRIYVRIAGNYLISYSANCPAGSGLTTSFQVLKNDTTLIPGSERFAISSNTDEDSVTGNFIVSLAANEYITLQSKASTGTPNLAVGVTLVVVHAAGQKGDKGEASATDVDAIHDNVGGEIALITEKTTPASDDLLIIEDSAASNNKKKLKIGNLPSGLQASDTAPVNITKATASAGVATAASRQDHKHDVATAAPAAIAAGDTASEGTATSLSRSDHQHAVSAASPTDVGTANSAGTAATFVRSDHVHAGLTRGSGDFNLFTAKSALVAADIFLVEDSAASNAKKKSTLDNVRTSLFNYNSATATGTITLTGAGSTTDTLATGMTLTPAAGTYIVWFAGSTIQNTNAALNYMSIWSAGTQVAASEQRLTAAINRGASFNCVAVVTVNGSQAIEGRWRVSGTTTTGTMYQRSLIILRVA